MRSRRAEGGAVGGQKQSITPLGAAMRSMRCASPGQQVQALRAPSDPQTHPPTQRRQRRSGGWRRQWPWQPPARSGGSPVQRRRLQTASPAAERGESGAVGGWLRARQFGGQFKCSLRCPPARRRRADPDRYCRQGSSAPSALSIGALQLLGLRVDPALCNPPTEQVPAGAQDVQMAASDL